MKTPRPSDEATSYHQELRWRPHNLARSRKLLIATLIFVAAIGVRLLNRRDHGHEVPAVQTSVTSNYKHQANLILENGLLSLYDGSSTTSNPDLLGHPIGYPILLALVQNSDTGIQILQILLDSLSAVAIALIAFELLPAAVGIIAGLLAAFAPQFSWNSILLLPDSLAALPILLAMLLIIRGLAEPNTEKDRQEFLSYFVAGALIGVSVWLRANALLLAPFLALSILLIDRSRARFRRAVLLVVGAVVLIAPLTLRNAIVFHEFIPVSLGAGQTLIEGIADYDSYGSLGLQQTDVELSRNEAEASGRPEYANSLFTPDGPARDRARVRRGFSVIREHPVWFAGVMVRRAVSMFRLERTPLRLKTPNAGFLQSPLRVVQKLFITAIFLPLTLIGIGILIYQRRFHLLAILLAVPSYYLLMQSALHTEYRYVLVINYFFFMMAALAIYSIVGKLKGRPTA